MVAYPYDVSWQRSLVSHGGSVFFVDSTHASRANDPSNGDTPDRPFSTLAYAITQTVASNGDVIYCMPGHSETITTAVTPRAGVSVIGLGLGNNRPSFTGSGAIDVFNITAANVTLRNLRVIGAATAVTALINIAASDLTVEGCRFLHAETPLNLVTVASGATRFLFKDCKVKGTANGPDTFMFFEVGSSSIDEWEVRDCEFVYTPNGLDKACFLATADACPGGIIRNVTLLGLDLEGLFCDFNSSVSVGEGLLVNCQVQYIAAATVTDIVDLGGYGTARIAVSDGPNRGAILVPATSAT